jgi:hypothetical protein
LGSRTNGHKNGGSKTRSRSGSFGVTSISRDVRNKGSPEFDSDDDDNCNDNNYNIENNLKIKDNHIGRISGIPTPIPSPTRISKPIKNTEFYPSDDNETKQHLEKLSIYQAKLVHIYIY